MATKFWIVLADRESLFASVRHLNRELAKAEALRLAHVNRGTRFFVAAVTGVAEFPIQQIGWTELERE